MPPLFAQNSATAFKSLDFPKFPPPANILPRSRVNRLQIPYEVAMTHGAGSLEYQIYTAGQSLSNLEEKVYGAIPALQSIEVFRDQVGTWEQKYSAVMNEFLASGKYTNQARRKAALTQLQRFITPLAYYQLRTNQQFSMITAQTFPLFDKNPAFLNLATVADNEFRKRYNWEPPVTPAQPKNFDATLKDIESRLPLLSNLIADIAKEWVVPDEVLKAIRYKMQVTMLGDLSHSLAVASTPKELVSARAEYRKLEGVYHDQMLAGNETAAGFKASTSTNPIINGKEKQVSIKAETAPSRELTRKQDLLLDWCSNQIKIDEQFKRFGPPSDALDTYAASADPVEKERRIQSGERLMSLLYPATLLELYNDKLFTQLITESMPTVSATARHQFFHLYQSKPSDSTATDPVSWEKFLPDLKAKSAELDPQVREMIAKSKMPNDAVTALKARLRSMLISDFARSYVTIKAPNKVRELENEALKLTPLKEGEIR